jgi:hypothetical protein
MTASSLTSQQKSPSQFLPERRAINKMTSSEFLEEAYFLSNATSHLSEVCLPNRRLTHLPKLAPFPQYFEIIAAVAEVSTGRSLHLSG